MEHGIEFWKVPNQIRGWKIFCTCKRSDPHSECRMARFGKGRNPLSGGIVKKIKGLSVNGDTGHHLYV